MIDSTPESAGLLQRLDSAYRWGLKAGYHALQYYRQHLMQRVGQQESPHSTSYVVERKADRSFVTTADRETEVLLRELIGANFPDDAIVGEEYGCKEGTSGWTWYLDPIDGTQAFVHGVPLFGTLIGIEYRTVSQVGVIVLPAIGEALYAGKGLGSFWHRGLELDNENRSFHRGVKSPAKVSQVKRLDEALFCTTWMQSYQQTSNVELFNQLCLKTGIFRGWGDCYGYALVATGRAEIMVDPQLMVWDAAPLLVILEEAGGQYTSFTGERTIHGGNGFATNGFLHEAVLALIQR